jgi:hypothetical protein
MRENHIVQVVPCEFGPLAEALSFAGRRAVRRVAESVSFSQVRRNAPAFRYPDKSEQQGAPRGFGVQLQNLRLEV